MHLLREHLSGTSFLSRFSTASRWTLNSSGTRTDNNVLPVNQIGPINALQLNSGTDINVPSVAPHSTQAPVGPTTMEQDWDGSCAKNAAPPEAISPHLLTPMDTIPPQVAWPGTTDRAYAPGEEGGFMTWDAHQ
jgi:hypothetical protein